MNNSLPQPTTAELGLLQVLWDLGPATVRQVHEAFSKERPVQYTTVLKMLQTMHDKGLVLRDESERSHVYTAVLDRTSTQRGLLRDLLDRAFRGSSRELVLLALQEKPLERDEKSEIRALLDEAEKRRGK